MRQNQLSGLTSRQVEENRARYGTNILTPPEREPLWKQYLEKFKDPLIIVLLVVLVCSTGIAVFEYYTIPSITSEVFLEPLGVLIALLLATGVGFIFEVRAAREFDVLNQVGDETAVKVVRDGHIQEIQRAEVVVGDIVLVETGDEIPADGRLLEATSLSVNESTLTGEPLAHKWVVEEQKAAPLSEGDPAAATSAPHAAPAHNEHQAAYPADALMKGSTVMEGHGTMEVTAVGDQTDYGHVYTAAQIDNGVHTPLNRQLNRLGSWISKASFLLAGAIVVARMAVVWLNGTDDFTGSGEDQALDIIQYILGSIMIAVTLIVVAVPEGLPLSITLSLALSMKKMLRENNLVRKLHACETMGAATVICTDKTGTLTQNRMTVAEMVADEPLDLDIAINSTAWLDGDKVLGNPTEGALQLWLRARGVDYLALREAHAIEEQVPFSTENKYMSTTSGGHTYIKGAPEKVLALCGVEGERLAELRAKLSDWQNRAMRTLAFGRDGRFVGMCAIADPLRQEVPGAIRTCLRAGIRVIIVTGDAPNTAREIGTQIGLLEPGDTEGRLLTGEEFAAMSDTEIRESVLPRLTILSRARPMDKQRLVKLLQQAHEVVAVTGDGTNDAPALNAAHVGLSMGDGTAVAKEASDITIIDNSFSSIAKAVLWGRSLYNNIGRFILFQMTVNVAACCIVLVGAFLGEQSPLTVTQMLWVNLIMDTFAAMALSALPPERNVMLDKPRSAKAHIINREMLRHILGWGVLMTAILVYCWSSERVPDHLFFTIFVMLQFWNLFNARYFRTGRSLIHDLVANGESRATIRRQMSWGFVGIAILILVGQVAIVELGGKMFDIRQRLTIEEWAIVIASTSLIFVLGEGLRLLTFKKEQNG